MIGMSFYNSLTQKIEPFTPDISKKISLYCCGVTVYDHCHIGHGRVFVINDLMQRLFLSQNYECHFVRNITDIDDKILQRAYEQKRSWQDLAEEYACSMQQVCQKLGCLPVSHEPKATEYIDKIIDMISSLVAKGHAYVIDREVFFSVKSFPSYGKLSCQNLSALSLGHRIDIADQKKHAHDFTLWKPTDHFEVGWESPWGKGRPGWHIECSAMIAGLVSGPLDFHIGGMDLKFPHHENEIAQSESCYQHPLAHFWMHIGFVTVDGEKMSKSLNNFKYLSEFLEVVPSSVMRYLYLTTHYRQPLAFTEEAIQNAWSALKKIANLLGPYKVKINRLESRSIERDEDLWQKLLQPCAEDLNIPQAMAVFHHALNSLAKKAPAEAILQVQTLMQWGHDLLGIDLVEFYQPSIAIEHAPLELQSIANLRQAARLNKNYQEADHLRKKALDLGFEFIDTPDGLLYRSVR